MNKNISCNINCPLLVLNKNIYNWHENKEYKNS